MSAAIIAAVVAALLTTTGLTAAAALRFGSVVELVLAAYVLALAEIVALAMLLSPFGALTRPALLAAPAVICCATTAVWWRLGRPRPDIPSLRPSRAILRQSPVLALLGLVVVLALGYVVALIAGTAPNTWDSMTYHLARAAFWRQEGGVGYIAHAYDERLNANPPNAEVAVTALLELTRDERYAGLVQFTAVLACAAAVFAIARSLRLSIREAALGSLLFLTLPIVVLQASTTQNDLVLASLLLCATVFLLGGTQAHLALAGLATALAVGMKVTAVYGLPVLAVVCLLAPPSTARLRRLVAVAAGAVAGSYWYVVNVLESGTFLGRRPDTELVAILRPEENILGAAARVLDAFDLSGSEGTRSLVLSRDLHADVLLYVVVAVLLTAALIVISLVRGRFGKREALLAGALAVTPLLIPPVSYGLWRAFAKLHDLLGTPDDALPVGEWPAQETASDSYSWFGPLGILLVIPVAIWVLVLVRRRSLPPLALVLATAPPIWLVLVSATIAYDPWQGRFFIFPIALSASVWGILLRRPAAAWAAVAVGATTVALALGNFIEKPSGLRLLAESAPESVWTRDRAGVQSIGRPDMSAVLWFLDARVPPDASVALAFGEDDFGYPAFGRYLERRVELVPQGSDAREVDASWLVATPRRALEVEQTCWSVALHAPRGWKVFRRTMAGCPP
jgi:hypothetical protein